LDYTTNNLNDISFKVFYNPEPGKKIAFLWEGYFFAGPSGTFTSKKPENCVYKVTAISRTPKEALFASVLRQKSLYFDCHSGLDLACPVLDTGESSISGLDSLLSRE